MPRSGPSAVVLAGAAGVGCALARARGRPPVVGQDDANLAVDEPFLGPIKQMGWVLPAAIAGAVAWWWWEFHRPNRRR